ncbi:transient receptor potential channel pyrexia isoform X2 [Osmia bicornis bicornis]|uniref:transient receptor potential channel pyrexia isoform X2 n=1 Tax=Osmia bicornis bicornis TaxID=1437191 RepID=UPI0010F890DF|nr:transient receptor potential channel pyrexia isoform X2 [Osmia bicornis bicornis]
MKSNMSILKKKPLLSRLLSSHNSQEELNEEHVMTPPTIVINDTEDCEESENIWMDNIEKNSISSEHSSESIVTCHINEKQMTNQQLWNIEEIVQALSNLPAGEHALSLIPTLHGDTLRNCLDEFLNTDLNEVTLKNQKTTISSFANGHIQNTSLSIENEAAANATASQLFTRWPNTCLLVSCYLCHLDLVKALLSKNAKVTARDSDGRTPLHLAACAGSVKIIEELLKYGANPCEWDYNKKCTPLHCAAATGDFASVKCLIKSRADVNAGLSGKSPLYYAVVSNAADCVEALLQAGASPNNPQVYTETPLHVAASLGSVTCMKLLLSYGADVRVQFSSMRSTPLHLAAEEGSAECTKLLLDAGAACEVKNARGQAPMHLAALSQSAETLETLINFGATVSTEDNDGRTPLHAAVAKVTRGIELAGALINKADKFGYTPLHIAALNESSSTVMMLLSRGADVTARTKGGISALSFIVRRTPDVLPRFISRLDHAISVHDHELGDLDCELRLDFRPLVPGGRGETDLMLCLVEVGQRHVLKHPLCESFLYLKWLRIRKFFLLNLIFHSIFVAFFTSYIAVTYFWNVEKFKKILFWLVLIFTIVLAGKEFFQMTHGVYIYVKRWENWLQWSVILLSIIVLLMPINDWQHHVAAVAILLIWIELMMVVGRFPMFGLYIQMFTQVSINFFKFLGAYICLIIGFSLGFSVLHKNYKSFSNPLVGLLKTIIMMSGELEFEDVFFDEDAPILYSGTAHLMLLSFVILVTVILTNLMMGLAVSDIQELRRCAGLDRLVRRAELVAHLESMLFSKLLDHAPKRIVKACRQGALLLHPPHHCAIHIRPNDPREKRLPRDLIKAVYHLVSERKNRYINTKTTYTRNSNSTETGQFRLSRLYSTTSTNDNSQQLNEVVTELKRCSYNISAHLDNLTNKVENIARDYYN